MLRLSVALLLAPALFGQPATDIFTKAPPAVDEALRARVTQFYQLQVDRKYREAEALVAEDTKDYYYGMNRARYTSFEIQEIKYSDEFTKAIVMTRCFMLFPMPGMLDKPMPVPTRSRWKLVDGQWFWYVDMEELKITPWGKMGVGPDGQLAEPAPGAKPAMPSKQDLERVAARVSQGVRADKKSVRLNLGAPSSDQVMIENGMPGVVNLQVMPHGIEGLSVELQPEAVPARGKAAVVFSYKPGGTPPSGPVRVRIRVQQTNQVFPVAVMFTGKAPEAPASPAVK
jgi:hypothetical protein